MIVAQLNYNTSFKQWHCYLIRDPLVKKQYTMFSWTAKTAEEALKKVKYAAYCKGVKIDAVWGNDGEPLEL